MMPVPVMGNPNDGRATMVASESRDNRNSNDSSVVAKPSVPLRSGDHYRASEIIGEGRNVSGDTQSCRSQIKDATSMVSRRSGKGLCMKGNKLSNKPAPKQDNTAHLCCESNQTKSKLVDLASDQSTQASDIGDAHLDNISNEDHFEVGNAQSDIVELASEDGRPSSDIGDMQLEVGGIECLGLDTSSIPEDEQSDRGQEIACDSSQEQNAEQQMHSLDIGVMELEVRGNESLDLDRASIAEDEPSEPQSEMVCDTQREKNNLQQDEELCGSTEAKPDERQKENTSCVRSDLPSLDLIYASGDHSLPDDVAIDASCHDEIEVDSETACATMLGQHDSCLTRMPELDEPPTTPRAHASTDITPQQASESSTCEIQLEVDSAVQLGESVEEEGAYSVESSCEFGAHDVEITQAIEANADALPEQSACETSSSVVNSRMTRSDVSRRSARKSNKKKSSRAKGQAASDSSVRLSPLGEEFETLARPLPRPRHFPGIATRQLLMMVFAIGAVLAVCLRSSWIAQNDNTQDYEWVAVAPRAAVFDRGSSATVSNIVRMIEVDVARGQALAENLKQRS